ncbi:DUF488 domain-containing protein [Devosia sp. A449]
MGAHYAIKRIYEPAASEDGVRVLVDRLWPRGVSKDEAKIDHWLKDVAPSSELRTWFGHEPVRWDEFRRRYRAELHDNNAALDELRQLTGKVTLLYGAHDEAHNQAVVLLELLQSPRKGAS